MASVAVAGCDVYVIYTLICHLFQYVTTIHREPDEVLLLCSFYGLGLLLKAIIATYGYHFANEYTERTPENFKYLFSFMNITFAYNLISTFVLYKFTHYHTDNFNTRFAAVPEFSPFMSPATVQAMDFALFIMKMQLVAYAIYYFMWRSLFKKELAQPKIVDTVAASIKYMAGK